jgi:hypothetical protein
MIVANLEVVLAMASWCDVSAVGIGVMKRNRPVLSPREEKSNAAENCGDDCESTDRSQDSQSFLENSQEVPMQAGLLCLGKAGGQLNCVSCDCCCRLVFSMLVTEMACDIPHPGSNYTAPTRDRLALDLRGRRCTTKDTRSSRYHRPIPYHTRV